MTPTTPNEWLAVANERAADAVALIPVRPDSTGPIYLAGYAIECSLKAYLRGHGRPFPTAGQEGHNLKGLWRRAGFRLRDLKDPSGAKTFFVESWGTHLRYEAAPGWTLSSEDLLRAARSLNGWIQTRVRRQRRRSRRPG